MSNISRRNFLRLAATSILAGPAVLAACARGSRKKVINFLNWSGYIGKETLLKFEQETGVEVNYETYASEQEMFGKLQSGGAGYDLVVTTDYLIPRLKALKLIIPLPQNRLKNLSNIAKRFRDPVYDPSLAYTVPYLWGTTGLGFNKTRFTKPPNSWRILWDEKYRGRISMLDNAREALGCALLVLGLPTDSKDRVHLEKARDLLIRQRPLIRRYSSSTYPEDLAAGELWMAQSWNGDILQAARENKPVNYAFPQEGSFIWEDCLCLLDGEGSKEGILRFVDYLLRPEVAAEITNTTCYATCNEKAMPMIESALIKDTRIFPVPEVEKSLRRAAPVDPEAYELWNRVWSEVREA